MADLLVLRFAEVSTEPVEWLIVDQSGVQHGQIEHGDLKAAAEAAEGKRVIALVPGTNVFCATVNIPIRNQGKLLQAIPFALEEQLAGDIDELHFSMGKRDEHGSVPVVVVQRLKMEAWLEQISAVELDLVGVYSESDGLGEVPNTTILLVEKQRAILRDATGQVTATDIGEIDALIDMWLQQHKLTNNDEIPPPINLLIYVSPEGETTLQPMIDRLRPQVETLEIMVLPDGGLPRLAAQSIVAPGINLLHGTYARRSKFGAYWPAWRVAASLLVGLCIILLGSRIFEISSLNRQVAQLDQAIEQAMHYTFPEVRELRDARALFDSKLRALGNANPNADSDGFLETLDSIAGAATKNSGSATIESINYRSGIMELRVVAPNVETLDQIREAISQDAGLQAEIQSANPDGEQVRGRLQIKRGGA